jgi:hypothetical protein
VSAKYRETVCTGGVFADTGRLVRLYPIPLRYMDDEKLFQKYHWIEADVMRASDHDRRPESYRINPDRIVVRERIGTSDSTWRDRARWVLPPGNTFASVEALQAQQRIDHTSLGVVKPKKIVQIVCEPYSKHERDGYHPPRRYGRIFTLIATPSAMPRASNRANLAAHPSSPGGAGRFA